MSLHDFVFLSLHQQAVKISNCIDNLLIEAYTALNNYDHSIENGKCVDHLFDAQVFCQKLSWYIEIFEKKAKLTKLSNLEYKEFFSKNTLISNEIHKRVALYLKSLQDIVCERVGIKRIESDYINLIKYDNNKNNKNEYIRNSTFYANKSKNKSFIVLLDNVRSPFNVGSIIRTAEAFNFETVYLTGLSATTDEKKIRRSAMNSEKFINLIRIHETYTRQQTINSLKKDKYRIIAFEKTSNSIPINSFNCNENCVIIVGNEEFGIQENLLEYCDQYVHIPLYGIKNSLNVSNAFAIAAYTISKNI